MEVTQSVLFRYSSSSHPVQGLVRGPLARTQELLVRVHLGEGSPWCVYVPCVSLHPGQRLCLPVGQGIDVFTSQDGRVFPSPTEVCFPSGVHVFPGQSFSGPPEETGAPLGGGTAHLYLWMCNKPD